MKELVKVSPIFSFTLAKELATNFSAMTVPCDIFVRKLGFTRFKTGARLLEIMVLVCFLTTQNLNIMN